MAPILRSTSLLAFFFCHISLFFCFFASNLPISSGSEDSSYTITGRVRIPATSCSEVAPEHSEMPFTNVEVIMAGIVIGHAAKFSNIKVILNGGQSVTFLRPDGYFTLYPIFLSSNNILCRIIILYVRLFTRDI